ncbi:MAG: M23 family metallopeptidase [Clostridia bacterium]|nr:M23 family metallopeptidase [Clostridia bacterium]
MKKYRFKKSAVYVMYGLGFALLIGILVITDSYLTVDDLEEPDYDYVTETVLDKDEDVPVVNTDTIIIKPYSDQNVKILKNYYDYTAEKEQQENSILYYESTYMQNSAVAYGGVDSFDIVSILDGTVVSIKEDELLGNIVEIEHDNKVISVYQSISEVLVKENQAVKQGEVIAKSGASNLNKSLNSHLLFELIIDSKIVNPEEYYNKNINEL